MPDIEGVCPQLDAEGLRLQERHRNWWRRQGMLYRQAEGGPLGDLWLPLADGTLATHDISLEPEMLDLDRLAGEALTAGPLAMHDDAFDVAAPYSRVPWVEAILGCPIRATIQGGSMRTEAFIPDWETWESQTSHRHDGWFDALKELTSLMAQRAHGRQALAQTLMRGPTDLAEAVLGPELMCLSLYDHPQALRRFLDEVTETFIEILEAQRKRIPQVDGGYVNSFGVWAPGSVVRTQCDASAILSPRQYQEWFLPYDEQISNAVGYATIHLHSCSLHVVEPLMAVSKPQVIQVTIETDGPHVPTLEEATPIFRRILEAKCLIADGPLTEDQVSYLQDELPQDGLYIRARQAAW